MSHASRLLRLRRAVLSLGPTERRLAVTAWLCAPLVEACLGLAGLARTLRWLERATAQAARSVRTDTVTVERMAWLVDSAYRVHLLRGRCLPRSLLQYGLHRSTGAPVRFVVGIRRDRNPNERAPSSYGLAAGALQAHAWVEPIGTATPDATSARKAATAGNSPTGAGEGPWSAASTCRGAATDFEPLLVHPPGSLFEHRSASEKPVQ